MFVKATGFKRPQTAGSNLHNPHKMWQLCIVSARSGDTDLTGMAAAGLPEVSYLHTSPLLRTRSGRGEGGCAFVRQLSVRRTPSLPPCHVSSQLLIHTAFAVLSAHGTDRNHISYSIIKLALSSSIGCHLLGPDRASLCRSSAGPIRRDTSPSSSLRSITSEKKERPVPKLLNEVIHHRISTPIYSQRRVCMSLFFAMQKPQHTTPAVSSSKPRVIADARMRDIDTCIGRKRKQKQSVKTTTFHASEGTARQLQGALPPRSIRSAGFSETLRFPEPPCPDRHAAGRSCSTVPLPSAGWARRDLRVGCHSPWHRA